MSKTTVPITLSDGKPRHLRYDFNALCALEEETGLTVESFEEIISAPGRRLRSFRCLLWAGLLHEEPALTSMEVGKLIDMEQLPAIGLKITEAVAAAFKVEKDEGEPKNSEAPATEEKTPPPKPGANT